MKHFKRLQAIAWAVAVLLAVQISDARTRKGDHFFKLGQKAEAAKDYDRALDYFDQALATDAKDPGYLIADQRIHSKAAEYHIDQGKLLQQQQKLNEALVEFQRAMLADPSSQIAAQEIRITTQMVRDQQHAAPGTPILTPAERARLELEKRINSLEAPPELKPLNDTVRQLQMNNEPAHVLYETLGKLAGINVLFDPEGIETVVGARFNVSLSNVTLQEALNDIALQTNTFWKAVNHNSIFVTKESQAKRQEYQDQVVKIFYLQNASTAAEVTEIFNAVRTGAHLGTGIFQIPSQNAILCRGTPEAIAVAEKLVHDLDQPKAEVIVDVLVMEVNKTKTQTLGAALLGQGGLSVPVVFTPRNAVTVPTTGTTTSTTTSTTTGTTTSVTTGLTTTSTTGLTTGNTTSLTTGVTTTTSGTTTASQQYFTVANLGHVSSADFATSLPSALLQALMTDTSSRILQRPQIRCTDGGKASLKIGEKIPYASGSLSAAVGVGSALPYASTQFQQIDVGVNIDLQPHVNGPDDVSMQIKVELSNQAGSVNIGGLDEPIITQRINEATIRMRDGEVGLLGGLSDRETDQNNSGVPGITNIPVLGYLFGAKTKTNSDDEILIALIPHIVRKPEYSGQGEPGIYTGSENVVRVQRKADGSLEPTGSQPTPPVQPPTYPAPSAPYTPVPAPNTNPNQGPAHATPPATINRPQ